VKMQMNLAVLLVLLPLLADYSGPSGIAGLWLAWTFDPGVVIGLVLLVVVYLRGWLVLGRRIGKPGRTLWHHFWAFATGILALVLALLSPIDRLAEQFFSVHMVQHTLLIMAAAPLLVLAYPLTSLLLGLPRPIRRWLGILWKRSAVLRRLWEGLSYPLAAWLLQAVFFWGWHAPILYQAAVENDAIHAVEHLTFLGSAMLFWWVAFHNFTVRPQRIGAGILYLVTASLQSGLLGVFILFSQTVWYGIYNQRVETWGMTPLADQQLAGTIMGVPGGFIYLLGALWMIKSWLASRTGSHLVRPGS
jgi:putative membrane protein